MARKHGRHVLRTVPLEPRERRDANRVRLVEALSTDKTRIYKTHSAISHTHWTPIGSTEVKRLRTVLIGDSHYEARKPSVRYK